MTTTTQSTLPFMIKLPKFAQSLQEILDDVAIRAGARHSFYSVMHQGEQVFLCKVEIPSFRPRYYRFWGNFQEVYPLPPGSTMPEGARLAIAQYRGTDLIALNIR